MLQNIPTEIRTLFLLEFTKELIKNSIPQETTLSKPLNKIRKPIIPKPNLQKKFIRPITNFQKKPSIISNQPRTKQMPTNIPPPRALRIPNQPLPSTMQDVHPAPTSQQIDLGKLNPFVKDTSIKIIECYGDNEPIIVKGNMGSKTTTIVLTKTEINDIIDKFSKAAKIPTQEGLFKVVVGKLVFSAIISEVISSKFTIQKLLINPRFQKMPAPRGMMKR